LQQVPSRELKQAKRKASDEVGEIYNIYTKLENEECQAKKKLQKKQQKFLQGFVLNLQISFREFKQEKRRSFRI
jgi:hypothetical protein